MRIIVIKMMKRSIPNKTNININRNNRSIHFQEVSKPQTAIVTVVIYLGKNSSRPSIKLLLFYFSTHFYQLRHPQQLGCMTLMMMSA